MKSEKLAWIGLAVALMLILIGAGCQRRQLTNNELFNNTTNVVNNTVDNTVGNNTVTPPTNTIPDSGLPSNTPEALAGLKQEFQDAQAALKSMVVCGQTKSDLALTIVSSKFINTLSDEGLDTNWFIFTSPSDNGYYYLINMPRKGKPYKRLIMPQTDFDFDFAVLPIPIGPNDNLWKKSYLDALYKAEELGGAKFRAEHKTFEVSTILAYPAAGEPQLSWSVTYKATDKTGALFKVQVNATTGEGLVVKDELS